MWAGLRSRPFPLEVTCAIEERQKRQDCFFQHPYDDEGKEAAKASGRDCAELRRQEAEEEMTDFPTIVYRVPGRHYGADGRGFDYLGVDDAEAFEAALADGWHATMEEAEGRVAAEIAEDAAEEVVAEVIEAAEAIAELDPETRDALEAKAKELGVRFNGRTSDKVLAERIAAAQ